MLFPEWVAREKIPIKQVAERCGVSRASITNAASGRPLETFELAAALSAFTGGEVSIAEISDPTGEVRARIAREVVPWQRVLRDRVAQPQTVPDLRERALRVREIADELDDALANDESDETVRAVLDEFRRALDGVQVDERVHEIVNR